ncbi:Fatty acid desaturase 2 [Oryzias melastigma]|uniref:acyl-CoA (8-3)-desaturase n=1 Tax=Oryzias melastigma TaxID=30732 RepID=A0A834FR82_ORYME|nr:Fatty acid desaturase 2 [Oryzias melastigma]
MGGGGQLSGSVEPSSGRDSGVFTWEEVQKHCTRTDQWLVINRKVYNITQWVKRHPGGSRVISHYAGEDATEAFTAFHPDLKFVQKFLKPLLIGELAPTEPSQDRNKNASIIQDFENLRVQAEKKGLFKTNPLFFGLHLGHILLLEALRVAPRLVMRNWLDDDIFVLNNFGNCSVAGWMVAARLWTPFCL